MLCPPRSGGPSQASSIRSKACRNSHHGPRLRRAAPNLWDERKRSVCASPVVVNRERMLDRWRRGPRRARAAGRRVASRRGGEQAAGGVRALLGRRRLARETALDGGERGLGAGAVGAAALGEVRAAAAPAAELADPGADQLDRIDAAIEVIGSRSRPCRRPLQRTGRRRINPDRARPSVRCLAESAAACLRPSASWARSVFVS